MKQETIDKLFTKVANLDKSARLLAGITSFSKQAAVALKKQAVYDIANNVMCKKEASEMNKEAFKATPVMQAKARLAGLLKGLKAPAPSATADNYMKNFKATAPKESDRTNVLNSIAGLREAKNKASNAAASNFDAYAKYLQWQRDRAAAAKAAAGQKKKDMLSAAKTKAAETAQKSKPYYR